MKVSGIDIGMTRGDTESLDVTMKDGHTGEQVPFEAGDVATMTVRKARKQGSQLLFAITAASYEDSTATFWIPPELTADLKAGDYVYDVQVTFADGDIKTIVGGGEKDAIFHLWQDVTYE